MVEILICHIRKKRRKTKATKMVLHKCDICKSEFKPDQYSAMFFSFEQVLISSPVLQETPQVRKKEEEFCKDCASKIKEFIKGQNK